MSTKPATNFAGSGPAGSCDRITQQDQQQQFVEKNLKELDEQLQTKNDEISPVSEDIKG